MTSNRAGKGTAVRLTILGLWVVLFALLIQRDYMVRTLEVREQQALERSREESFMGVYFRDERIGYVRHRARPADGGGLRLAQDAFLHLNILDKSYPVTMEVEAGTDAGYLLEDFSFSLVSPFYRMQAWGRVEGREVHLRLRTGKEEIEDTIRLSRAPYISTNQRGYLLAQGLKEGDRLRIPYFDPVSMTGKDTLVEYRGRDKILVRGRIHNLHHFVESFSGIRINSWLDEAGKVIKEESPAGFVFIAEPEFQATDVAAKGQEILASVSVPVAVSLPAVETLTRLRVRLKMPEDVELTLGRDRQELIGDTLTVVRETPPAAGAGICGDRPEELASTPYVQAMNRKIVEQAAKIVATAATPVEKVERLRQWVFANLDKRPVIGIPDALTTLETGQGDCNEHAVLFAALARSAGIPTRIAAGVMYTESAFFYHAWNEVCLDGQWISLDTTRGQLPADVTHIKFVSGETEEQVKIGALMGNLGIEILDYSPSASGN